MKVNKRVFQWTLRKTHLIDWKIVGTLMKEVSLGLESRKVLAMEIPYRTANAYGTQ